VDGSPIRRFISRAVRSPYVKMDSIYSGGHSERLSVIIDSHARSQEDCEHPHPASTTITTTRRIPDKLVR